MNRPQPGDDAATVPAPDRGAGFEAATRHGPVRLRVAGHDAREARGAPPDDLRAVLLLDGAEPLLAWLEDWIAEPLDPAPWTRSPASAPPCARMTWRGAGVDAVVDLPWTLLAACRPTTELAARLQDALAWEPVEAQLVLAAERLDEAEWQALRHPGAGLLLADSFAPDGGWACALRLAVRGSTLAWPARWQPATRRLAWDAAAQAAPADADTFVALARPLAFTPPELLGWQGEPRRACAPGELVLLRAGRAQPALHGRLMPAGLRATTHVGDGPQAGYFFLSDGT